MPVRLFEIGSSAGLNLVLDQYEYDFGGEVHGRKGSPVRLSPVWEGPAPGLKHGALVAERQGCDLSPLDVTDPSDVLRLRAYIWPDQRVRQERFSRAIALAAEERPQIDVASAEDWIPSVITEDRTDGSVTVLMHSLVYCYLPAEAQQKITDHMQALGDKATPDNPLAWVSYELNDKNHTELSLRIWPGAEERIVADGHPHVTTLRYLKAPE